MQENEQKPPDIPQPKRVQSSFAVKDFITLGFSTAALTLSVAAFYFTNFRIDNKLQARVAETTLDTSSESSANPEVYVLVRVAFINAGNRPAIVFGATYQLSNRPNTDNGAFGADCVTAKETFPLLIQPHDMRLVDLRIPASHIIGNFESGAPVTTPTSSESGKESEFFYALEFKSLDSEGIYHNVWSDFFGTVNVSKKRLVGIEPLSGKEYLVTDLFHDKEVRSGGVRIEAVR